MDKITIAIPCYNEEPTIAKVIKNFQKTLPQSEILVIDNNSSDKTASKAIQAGAQVVTEKRQGKGYAVQRAFQEFQGDILVLVDGDNTYSAKDAPKLIKLVKKGEADMAVGNRVHRGNDAAFSWSHWQGNKALTAILNFFFKNKLSDMESGLRAMNRNLVDNLTLLEGGFGIEPEITIQAIERGFKIKELPISLKSREEGSFSKLNTFRDGSIVLYTMFSLFRDYKPLHFFSLFSSILLLLGIIIGWYGLEGYFQSGIVTRIPSLIVSVFLLLSSFTSFTAGLILSSIKRRHDELVILIKKKSPDF